MALAARLRTSRHSTYLTQKKRNNRRPALTLRQNARWRDHHAGNPFEASDAQEIDDLVALGVFRFERYDPHKHCSLHLFNSRMVREIKVKTEIPHEQSRLIVTRLQRRGQEGDPHLVPPIQCVSQRILVALAPGLIALLGIAVELCDVTQA